MITKEEHAYRKLFFRDHEIHAFQSSTAATRVGRKRLARFEGFRRSG